MHAHVHTYTHASICTYIYIYIYIYIIRYVHTHGWGCGVWGVGVWVCGCVPIGWTCVSNITNIYISFDTIIMCTKRSNTPCMYSKHLLDIRTLHILKIFVHPRTAATSPAPGGRRARIWSQTPTYWPLKSPTNPLTALRGNPRTQSTPWEADRVTLALLLLVSRSKSKTKNSCSLYHVSQTHTGVGKYVCAHVEFLYIYASPLILSAMNSRAKGCVCLFLGLLVGLFCYMRSRSLLLLL